MGPLIALVFLAVPVLEVWLLIQVGSAIGFGWTLLLLIADAVLGAWLVRREGRRAWRALQAALREAPRTGRIPGKEITDGALVLIGGTLLLTPGFATDVVGLVCILPVTRPLVRALLARLVTRRLRIAGPARPDLRKH